jgi:hypothetical protein
VTALKSLLPLEDGLDRPLEELDTEDIMRVMVRVQRLRHEKVTDLEDLTVQLGEAKKTATQTHARTFLQYRREGRPEQECTQQAKLAAADDVFEADALDGAVKACRARLDILQDDWDSCRSAGANTRAKRSATEGFGS